MTGVVPHPIEAFKQQPYKVIHTTLIAIGVGIALFYMGMLNPASALLTGFGADSAAGALKRKTNV